MVLRFTQISFEQSQRNQLTNKRIESQAKMENSKYKITANFRSESPNVNHSIGAPQNQVGPGGSVYRVSRNNTPYKMGSIEPTIIKESNSREGSIGQNEYRYSNGRMTEGGGYSYAPKTAVSGFQNSMPQKFAHGGTAAGGTPTKYTGMGDENNLLRDTNR